MSTAMFDNSPGSKESRYILGLKVLGIPVLVMAVKAAKKPVP